MPQRTVSILLLRSTKEIFQNIARANLGASERLSGRKLRVHTNNIFS